jgi:PKD repeat protein
MTIEAQVPGGAPVADFEASRTEGDAPLAVTFTDLSQEAGSWEWDFGDGSTANGSNPSHTYNVPGTYTVSLTVSNALGSDSITKVDYITVTKDLYVLYFPYVVSSGMWTTKAAIVNTNPTMSLAGVMRYFDSAGNQIMAGDYPDGGIYMDVKPFARSEFAVMNGEVAYMTFTTRHFGARGYAEFSLAGRQRAVVPAIEHVNTDDAYLHHLVTNDNWESRLVFLNTTDTQKNLVLDFSGVVGKGLVVPAHSHVVTTIKELFGFYRPTGIRSGIVRNGEGVVGIELFEGMNQMYGIVIEDAAAETIYYPHAASSRRWETGVAIQNTINETCMPVVTTYNADGSVAETTSLVLPGFENYVKCWKNMDMLGGATWFKVESMQTDHLLSGFVSYYSLVSDQAAGFNNVGSAKNSGVFPKLDQSGWTGMGMVNVGEGDATVRLSAYTDPGTRIAVSDPIVMVPNQKVLGYAPDLLGTDISAATYITYSSDRPIVGFQLNCSGDDAMLDALPAL